MNAIAMSIDFAALTCWSCGMSFAMPWMVKQKRVEDGKAFYCPAGCCLSFGKSEVDKLKEQLEAKEREVERQKKRTEWAKRETEHERRRHASTKGHVTRIKKRIANGVCPCCNRTFVNLTRHMKTKHPAFATEPTEGSE